MTVQSFDYAQDKENYLPGEPLDLPRENEEIPAHASSQNYFDDQAYVVRTLLSWTAPGRPFRKRKKEFYLSSLLIMLLVEIIIFIVLKDYLLMLAVLSLVFLAFALASVPPHNFRYRISTEGLGIEDHFYLWQELYDFYFKKRDGIDVLHVRTRALIPGELSLTIEGGGIDKEHVQAAILPFLAYREFVKPTFMEKAGDWLSRNFPLEKAT